MSEPRMPELLVRQAERVLCGETLADKLSPLDGADTSAFDPTLALCRRPGRPAELPLHDSRAGRHATPRPKGITSPRARGRVLHAFVNHELLALELFALALIRFPDAPRSLRTGWRAAAVDEQRHLAQYLARMEQCGVALGEEFISAFFWDALHEAPTAESFTLGMALVLEQANLDFTRGWGRAFREAGDDETAEVLSAVYEDEIRHVRIGAALLKRLSERPDEHRPAVAILAEHLRPPLGLSRARGRGFPFDRAGRQRAGLDDIFIDEIEVTGGSTGRHPRVFWFDPFTEDTLARRPIARPDLAEDLAILPLFLASADDIVLAEKPSLSFLRSLAQAGFPIPHIARNPDPQPCQPRPWAYGPRATERYAGLGLEDEPRAHVAYDRRFVLPHLRAWTEGIGLPLVDVDLGVLCSSLSEVQREVSRGEVVIKAVLSTAGGHRVRARTELDERANSWVKRTLETDGAVLVEPWLDVVAEISVQGELQREGERYQFVGATRFGAIAGVYRGTVVGPVDCGCSPSLRRLLRGDGAVEPKLEVVARRIAETLDGIGHRGPFGVDFLVVASGDGYRLKLGEINPRTTMGHVALGIRRRLAPGSMGFHAILPTRILTPALADYLVACWPVTRTDERMSRGCLLTTERARARKLCALLWVGPSWRESVDALQRALSVCPDELRNDAAKLRESLRWLEVGS